MRAFLAAYGRQILRVLAAVAGLTVIAPAQAPAQYFGRNKVQYDKFQFRVLETDHFRIHYYPEMEDAIGDAARMAERWYERLARLFQHEFAVKKPIILYADHPDFQQTNALSGVISEGTGGVTESLKDRVILPLTGIYKDTDHVMGHELVHAFQYDISRSRRGGYAQGFLTMPLWLIEGMAEYLSLGRVDSHTAMWLRDSALREELPTLGQLTRDTRFFPYRYGQALWAYVGGRWGDPAVPTLFRRAGQQGWERALAGGLGMSEDSLSRDWIRDIRAEYFPLMQGRTHPRDAGLRVLAPDIESGSMNLAPTLSPDGSRVVFISERDLFAIELFVADARTGKVIRKLTSSASDTHYDALSFISSSGSWSPDGEKFVFVVIADGDHVLNIVDVESGHVDRRIPVPGVGSLSNPAWSPDGQYIAFSGTAGGISDLYLLDLRSGTAERITNDRYADLQPAWAPGGRTLAFVTDRAGTDLDLLTYGDMQIALLDLTSRQITTLDLFPQGKHINPQFSPDGRSLYFISDHDGFSDVYRVVLPGRELFRVTEIATGVSGITAMSPAMSVAAREGRMMFSVFDAGQYNGYALESAQLTGSRIPIVAVNGEAGLLPPIRPLGVSFVSQYLADAETGLPPADAFGQADYDPALQLDYVGQPTFGVGVDRFGTGVAGATAVFFSDMLGNRNLALGLQANGRIQDIGGQAVYTNLRSRWNWGVAGGRIPYLLAYTSVGAVGLNTIEVNQLLQRIYIDQAVGLVSYPLSSTRRLEANGGLTRYSYGGEIETFLMAGNQVVDHRREDLPKCTSEQAASPYFSGCLPDALNLFQAAIAYVGDYSFFAFTSPVRGGRFRFEIQETLGTLNYRTLLADYRRYFFGRPVTLAARGLHYGRFGADASTGRLNPLFLGYETFVRGYAAESFQAAECSDAGTTAGACPAWNRLFGSRIGVFNMEVRLPLFGVPEFGLINFPYLPTEIGAFVDGGAAWQSQGAAQDELQWRFDRETDQRVPVFSTGVNARFNVLGFLIFEAYYAYPFQRPDRGWHWGFQLAPGW